MSRTPKIPNSETSEKALEERLVTLAKKAGGLALKYYNPNATGYPDRLVCAPGGKAFWVELKSKGCHPTHLQFIRITNLRELGFRVFICDSPEAVDEAIEYLKEISVK